MEDNLAEFFNHHHQHHHSTFILLPLFQLSSHDPPSALQTPECSR